MNWGLARAFWMHRIRSRMRMGLILLAVVTGLLRVAMVPGTWPALPWDAVYITMLLGFGMISQDVSSGAAQMILVRPVTRFEYLFSRYIATCLGALAVVFVEATATVAIAGYRGAPLGGGYVLAAYLSVTSKVISFAAVVVLLSGMSRGLGDVASYAALLITTVFMNFLDTVARQPWAGRIQDVLEALVTPGFEIQQLIMGGATLWQPALQLVAIIVGCFALGYLLFRRRELTYSD